MAYSVDSILDESWKTGDKIQDEWLSRPENKSAREASSRFAKEMKALDDLNTSIAGGAPQTSSTEPAKPYGGEYQPGGNYYIGQRGEITQGDAPQSGFVVGPDARGKPSYQFRIDGRAPLAQAELKSRNDTSQFFASKHGVVTQNDAAWAQQFPSGPTASRIAAPQQSQPFVTPLPPLNSFSTTSGDARSIARQYGGDSLTLPQPFNSALGGDVSAFRSSFQPYPTQGTERVDLKISNPHPNAPLDFGTLPPSPLDDTERRKYR